MRTVDKAIKAIDKLTVAKYKVKKRNDEYEIEVKKDGQGRLSVSEKKNGKFYGVFFPDNEKQLRDYLRYNFGIKS